MNLRDEIAEIVSLHGQNEGGRRAADAILAKLRPATLVWQRNGNHWAGGYGYVIRKMGSQYTLTERNKFDRQFDTIEDAKAAADENHIAAWRKAGGLEG